MTTQAIDRIISGYITELKENVTDQFSYINGVLYPFSNRLTDYEYKLVEFIGELIIIKLIVEYGTHSKRELRTEIDRLQNKYEHELLNFYPLSCAIDSLYMELEKGE